MADIKYEIVKKLGVLSTSSRGWSKELNLVSWNDRPAKYDIREWSPDGTLSTEEMAALKALIDQLEL
jgi:hypothetical protein